MPLGKSYEEYRAARSEEDAALQEDLREATVQLELGIALNQLQQIRALSQRALAELTGIKQPMLVRIERGSQSLGIEIIAKIIRALNGVVRIGPDGCITAHPMELVDASSTASRAGFSSAG